MKRGPLSFSEQVLDIVAHIPRGSTLTYKEIARLAGNSGASRAVGTLMSRNYNPKIPCHRVVHSDGKIGNYNRGGQKRKEELLRREGAL